MKKKVLGLSTKGYVGFCVLSLAYLSVASFIAPQSTMDLVNLELGNTDAISSIRGIYGGVGLTITTSLIYLFIQKKIHEILLFLSLFWGLYAISRYITILVDGKLGDFGNQWIVIESVLCMVGIILIRYNKRNVTH